MSMDSPDQAKARKLIGVPLNASAVAVLHAQIGKRPLWVFVEGGQPVDRWNDYE